MNDEDKATHDKVIAIAAKIEFWLDRHAPTAKNAPIGGMFSRITAFANASDVINMKAPPDQKAAFMEIFTEADALPDHCRVLLGNSLWLVNGTPTRLKCWGQGRGPHPSMMPDALKALRVGVSYLVHEDEMARAFRKFYALLPSFSAAAYRTKRGVVSMGEDAPHEPVQEYYDAADASRDLVQAAFATLDERYIALMNDRLRMTKPSLLHEDLAPIEAHDDEFLMERWRACNRAHNEHERNLAHQFNTGRVTVADLVRELSAGDYALMSGHASALIEAANLYFDDKQPLLTFELDPVTGGISNAREPVPETPVRQ